MKLKKAIKILKKHNKWRRGADIKPTNPTILGQAIDKIVTDCDKEDLLLDFLLYLYNRGLINNYDFEYVKEIKNYLRHE